MTVEELRIKRHEAVRDMRTLLDTAESQNREVTREERERFETLDHELREIDFKLDGGARDGDDLGAEIAGIGHAAPTQRTGYTLGREHRMLDWSAGRGVRSEFSVDEARNFDLGRAVRGMVTGRWDGADIERRALGEGADSTGGVMVPELLASFVIDRARNQARVLEAGAVVVPMDSDDVSVPRLASSAVPAWRLEHGAVAESDPGFERVRFQAKTIACFARASYELMQDMSAQSASAITNDLTSQIALALDVAALRGSGVNPVPLGVRNQPGVTVQSLGANGAVPTSWDALVDAVAAVQAANFQPNAAIYSPRAGATFAKLKDNTGQPLQRPPFLDGLALLPSAQIPNDLVQGTSNDASELYVAKWDELLIGVRPSLSVQVKVLDQPFATSNMQVAILCWLRADVQLAHPAAFAVTTGVRA